MNQKERKKGNTFKKRKRDKEKGKKKHLKQRVQDYFVFYCGELILKILGIFSNSMLKKYSVFERSATVQNLQDYVA